MFNYMLFTAMLGTVLFANKRVQRAPLMFIQRRTYNIKSYSHADILADPVLHAHVRRLRRVDGLLPLHALQTHTARVICMSDGKKVVAALCYVDADCARAVAPFASVPVDMGALYMSRGTLVYRFVVAEKYLTHAQSIYKHILEEFEAHVCGDTHYIVVAANVGSCVSVCMERGYTRVYWPRTRKDAYYIKYIYTPVAPTSLHSHFLFVNEK
jgi:hypothetical protein